MKDAVAEILGERRQVDGRTPYHFAASIVLHLAIAVAIVYAAVSAPSTPVKSVLNVRLAPAASRAAGGAPARSERARPKQPAKRLEPETRVAPPETKKAPEPKKASRGSTVFGRSDLPAPTKSVTIPPPPPRGGAGGSGAGTASGIGAVPGVGQAGVTGLEGGDFPYPTYIDRMITLVGRHWFRPQAGNEMIVQIYFAIERNGRIRDWKVEKSSGSALFDRAALRAVIESSPLPPLPLGYSGTYLGVHLTFH